MAINGFGIRQFCQLATPNLRVQAIDYRKSIHQDSSMTRLGSHNQSATAVARLGGQKTGRSLTTLLIGLFGGLFLGALARLWMRGIAVDPEFTWSGTLGIVIGFAIFGLTQSCVAIARTRTRPVVLSLCRFFAVVGMVPLFVAAGAPMLPTVVGGGLAVTRKDWHRAVRIVLVIIAAIPPVVISRDLIDKFGGSLQTLVGIVGLVAIYSTIVWATKFCFAPRTDGWRRPRWVTMATVVGVCVAVGIPLALGGIK